MTDKPNPYVFRAIRMLLVLCGVIAATFGINGFLLPGKLIDGGVVGMAMLIAHFSHWPLGILVALVNIPFLALGWVFLGQRFAMASLAAISILAICLNSIHFPVITHDHVLTAIFGGFFIGAGIGLAIRGSAVLDGSEIAALVLSKTLDGWRVGDIILIFNSLIFGYAALVLGPEPAMYSILTYLSAARTVNFVLHGIEEYTAVTIISPAHESIRQKIVHDLQRTVTLYRGAGGVSGDDQTILYCVITRLEIGLIKAVVREIDPQAFIVIQALADAEGGVIKKSKFTAINP